MLVAGFANLQLLDQMNLLQHSWLEILCLNLVFRSCPYNGTVCYAEDLRVPAEMVEAYNIPPELDSLTRKLCKKFTYLGVSREEYVLLKAIILCNIGQCYAFFFFCQGGGLGMGMFMAEAKPECERGTSFKGC